MKNFWQNSDGRRFMEKGTVHMYKNIVTVWRDATRKAKVQLELNLAKDVKNNKFFQVNQHQK